MRLTTDSGTGRRGSKIKRPSFLSMPFEYNTPTMKLERGTRVDNCRSPGLVHSLFLGRSIGRFLEMLKNECRARRSPKPVQYWPLCSAREGFQHSVERAIYPRGPLATGLLRLVIWYACKDGQVAILIKANDRHLRSAIPHGRVRARPNREATGKNIV